MHGGVWHSKHFTLFELIIVMTLLAMIMAMAAPQLTGFIRGRSLQSEADRFLSLTRLASSEAVSRAEYMELWIDCENGVYGLQVAAGYPDDDYTPRNYRLTEGLVVKTDGSKPVTGIFFTPEGWIDADDLRSICFHVIHDETDRICVSLDDSNSRFSINVDILP